MDDISSADREGLRRWLEQWRRAGPLLEAERWQRLAAMTQAEGQRASWSLLELWQPDWTGDQGEELLLHQQVFARARAHRR
jgi:hypothetical protein